MNAQHQTDEQVIGIAVITAAMVDAGLDRSFAADCFRLAQQNEGFYGLMELWYEADNVDDKEAALADLQELLDDSKVAAGPQQKPRLSGVDLDAAGIAIAEHKKRLRQIIDRHGGVSAVARLTGIPQPSLSRMLNDGRMPRRTTLHRIASALNVPEPDVIGEWVS